MLYYIRIFVHMWNIYNAEFVYVASRIPLNKTNSIRKSLSIDRLSGNTSVIRLPLHYDGNAAYYGAITIGTPPQNFNVAIDIAFPELIIPSRNCCSNVRKSKYIITHGWESHLLHKSNTLLKWLQKVMRYHRYLESNVTFFVTFL